jgi:hypothetical protein
MGISGIGENTIETSRRRQKYHLFSREMLSYNQQSEITNRVRGATLRWLGGMDATEKEENKGLYKYILECTALSYKDKIYLTTKMNLEIEPVLDYQTDISATLVEVEKKISNLEKKDTNNMGSYRKRKDI